MLFDFEHKWSHPNPSTRFFSPYPNPPTGFAQQVRFLKITRFSPLPTHKDRNKGCTDAVPFGIESDAVRPGVYY